MSTQLFIPVSRVPPTYQQPLSVQTDTALPSWMSETKRDTDSNK